MSSFALFIDGLLDREGGQVVPNDHNRGISKWGITWATATSLEPAWTETSIATLPRELAARFYERHFWNACRFGLIEDQALANKAADLAVNLGPSTAIKLLQEAVKVEADGALGPLTAAAANAMDPETALARLRWFAAGKYRAIALAHPEWNTLDGWLRRLYS